jgi:hypothetical protein
MFRIRSVVLSSALTMLLAACSEVPTDPAAANIPQSPSMVATSIEGLSFNSGSCTLVSSTTGEVRCSWDITNTGGKSLDYWPEAEMAITYNCLDTKGQIRKSGTGTAWSWLEYLNVTSTSITGTNQQLSTAALYNSRTRSGKRYNPCRTNQQLQITGYAMQYWDIWVDVEGESACLGSDNRYNCYVVVRL